MLGSKRFTVVASCAFAVDMVAGLWNYYLTHDVLIGALLASFVCAFISPISTIALVDCGNNRRCQIQVAFANALGYCTGTAAVFIFVHWFK